MAKSKPLRYLYLDGQLEPGGPIIPLLHKKLHINRGTDEILTWCYPLSKRVVHTYTDLKKRMQPAFSTRETAKMLNRDRLTIERAILDGNIEPPQFVYALNEHRRKAKYMWSESDVLRAHAYLCTVHRGRPRADGRVTPQKLPSARQLRAMMKNREILYVKVGDEFKPVWDAEDFT